MKKKLKKLLDILDNMLYTHYMRKKMDLLEQLEEYRLKNRLSQERLARLLDVSFQTVNRWLKGHCKPSKIHEYHIKKFLKENKK